MPTIMRPGTEPQVNMTVEGDRGDPRVTTPVGGCWIIVWRSVDPNGKVELASSASTRTVRPTATRSGSNHSAVPSTSTAAGRSF
jgi:hypothetical protein